MDLDSYSRRDAYTQARDEMFQVTGTTWTSIIAGSPRTVTASKSDTDKIASPYFPCLETRG